MDALEFFCSNVVALGEAKGLHFDGLFEEVAHKAGVAEVLGAALPCGFEQLAQTFFGIGCEGVVELFQLELEDFLLLLGAVVLEVAVSGKAGAETGVRL